MKITRPIFINGRFLGRPVSGVERYGREILRAWDALLVEAPDLPRPCILAPAGVTCDLALRAIAFRTTTGKRAGHIWEQIDLAYASSGGVLVCLANSGPVVHRRQIVVIHDAAVYRFGKNYGWRYRYLHKGLGRVLAKTAYLATVSQFSRDELNHYLDIERDRILILPNGSEHMSRVAADADIIGRLGLTGRSFLLAVGTTSRNKNIALALAAFGRLSGHDARLVIVGPLNDRIFADAAIEQPAGVLFPGRVSDGELKELLCHASALIFPSRYEGFGIPPLEAMVNGCPVIAADIQAVREVCSTAAEYCDPDDPETLATLMAGRLAKGRTAADVDAGQQRAAKFSWYTSADQIVQATRRLSSAE